MKRGKNGDKENGNNKDSGKMANEEISSLRLAYLDMSKYKCGVGEWTLRTNEEIIIH